MLRAQLIFAAALTVAACGRDKPADLANYQFNAPAAQVAAKLVALSDAHSRLSRIDAHRPPLAVESTITDGKEQVTIAVPGGTGKQPVKLTFAITPYLDGKYAMVALTMEAPDLEEIDLGPGRFAGTKTLGTGFGEALGSLASEVNRTYHRGDASDRFGRLFDLAAATDDPALRARVLSRGKQEDSVDFLFFDQSPSERFGDTGN